MSNKLSSGSKQNMKFENLKKLKSGSSIGYCSKSKSLKSLESYKTQQMQK